MGLALRANCLTRLCWGPQFLRGRNQALMIAHSVTGIHDMRVISPVLCQVCCAPPVKWLSLWKMVQITTFWRLWKSPTVIPSPKSCWCAGLDALISEKTVVGFFYFIYPSFLLFSAFKLNCRTWWHKPHTMRDRGSYWSRQLRAWKGATDIYAASWW